MLCVRCPEPWTSKRRGSAVTAGARGEPGGLAGHSRLGETLHGYHEKLAENADIGSYLAKRGKGSGSPSWCSQPAWLALWGRGEGCGGQALPVPCLGCRADGLPASQTVGHLSRFWLKVTNQQHVRTVKSNPVLGRVLLKPRVSPNLKA